jgi:hypothetical protein
MMLDHPGHPRLAATANALSRCDGQTGSGVDRPQRAEQHQEEGTPRFLVVFLIRVSSVIVGVMGTRWSSSEFRATAGCGSRPAELR